MVNGSACTVELCRGVATCTHVRTCVPEKVGKKKKDLGLEGGGRRRKNSRHEKRRAEKFGRTFADGVSFIVLSVCTLIECFHMTS